MAELPKPPRALEQRRRRSQRFPHTAQLQARCSSWETFHELFTANVSATGLFIPTDEQAESGDEVEVELLAPNDTTIHMVGRVAHIMPASSGQAGLGVRLVTVVGEDAARYHALVSEAAQRCQPLEPEVDVTPLHGGVSEDDLPPHDEFGVTGRSFARIEAQRGASPIIGEPLPASFLDDLFPSASVPGPAEDIELQTFGDNDDAAVALEFGATGPRFVAPPTAIVEEHDPSSAFELAQLARQQTAVPPARSGGLKPSLTKPGVAADPLLGDASRTADSIPSISLSDLPSTRDELETDLMETTDSLDRQHIAADAGGSDQELPPAISLAPLLDSRDDLRQPTVKSAPEPLPQRYTPPPANEPSAVPPTEAATSAPASALDPLHIPALVDDDDDIVIDVPRRHRSATAQSFAASLGSESAPPAPATPQLVPLRVATAPATPQLATPQLVPPRVATAPATPRPVPPPPPGRESTVQRAKAPPPIPSPTGGPPPLPPAASATRARTQGSEPLIAIDFGTSRSSVAVVRERKVTVLQLSGGAHDMASVVGFLANGAVVLDQRARQMLGSDPQNAINSPKRLLGRLYADREIEPYLGALAMRHSPAADGGIRLHAQGKTYTIEQVCAPIIYQLRLAAQQHLKQEVRSAVFTTPVSFDERRYAALERAAALAGIKVHEFVDEPTAAVLPNRYHPSFKGLVAVYDFGGGTFDFSVVEASEADVQVVATAGDVWLGGDDFDEALANAAANAFWREHQIELRNQVVQWQRLTFAAERAKRELSHSPNAIIAVPEVALTARGPIHLRFPVSRAQFAELSAGIIERSLDTCREALELSDIPIHELNALYLSGGTSYIPAVREALARTFGKTPTSAVAPERAVVTGAAVYAALIQIGSLGA